MAQARAVDRFSLYDRRFVQLIVIIVMAGLVMAFSASYPRASMPDTEGLPGDALKIFRSHFLYASVGLMLTAILSFIPPVWFQRLAYPGFLCFAGLSAVAAVFGREVNGARQWIEAFGFQFQPSEFAKLFLVVYFASLLAQKPLAGKQGLRTAKRIAMAFGLLLILLMMQGDHGMVMLVFLIILAMAYLGGAPPLLLVGLLVLGAAMVTGIAFTSPVRAARLLAWIDPVQYRTGAGFHILAMLVTLARGGLGGVGLGMAPEKMRQLPEPHTDSIFPVLGSELGLLFGSLPLLILLGLLIHRIFSIARWSRDNFGYFLCSGLGAMLGIQALINLMVATNMIPVTGLTLPFISYGGSSLFTYLMAAGMVLSVYRHNPPLVRE